MSNIETKVSELTYQTWDSSPQDLLRVVLNEFRDKVALSSSLGPEDQVLTHMLCEITDRAKIFTLDTGRLPQETYDVLDQTRARYGVEIEVLFPEAQQVQDMVRREGVNLFYRGVDLRRQCCSVRKIEPLKKRLASLEAWICGLRVEQSTTRSEVARVAVDETFGLIKVSPLAHWTTDQVWDYIRTHDIPYNALHDQGYPSIGCAPCTRAVQPGQDIRSGRWWWEAPEHKECGLHLDSDGTLGHKES
ncbi:MAG: phosphoadenylyl-sulfate reductase [Phycisphaerae bacterium]|nr:phosphoadenylyl-sulfate reductase [Phycisphaerae bacterium]